VALALLDERPDLAVSASDISPGAVELARANAARLVLRLEVSLERGLPDGSWDLVLANLPYVREDEWESLQPEIVRWEPREALVAPGATEEVATEALRALRPGGHLVLETADGAAAGVAELLERLGFEDVHRTHDLAGRERVVDGRRR
jgi:release factor glutamine methyltransferase